MKAFLMYPDRDFDPQQPLPLNEADLVQDLELNTLFKAMADGDSFLFEMARKGVLSSLDDVETIRYRQSVLKDCLKNPTVIRELYQIPLESMARKRKHWLGIFTRTPGAILSGSVKLLQMFVELLKHLKQIADDHADQFESQGFRTFFAMIQRELDDEYFAQVEAHLRALQFRDGALISAELGRGNEGANYMLRKPNGKDPNLVQRILTKRSPVYSFRIHPRDEHGGRALSEIRDRGLNQVANALAQSADHIDSFFNMLRIELAFYVGCLNLYERLDAMGYPVCFPAPAAADERQHSFRGLYDACLALTAKTRVVGNDGNADRKDLVIITGANQGGKSTFLRSIGVAQLMLQCGMFAPAEHFSANICQGLFTHYKRREDVTLKSGKFDEELGRMSQIADQIRPNSMILFNESFAATNEREGSEIARQITRALVEKRVKVFFVTHQYEFAHGFYESKLQNAIFLRAERKAGGGRTYRLFEGEPLQTSFGADLYRKIFEDGHLKGGD
jgi:DNA mismatch repair ATPase MutS